MRLPNLVTITHRRPDGLVVVSNRTNVRTNAGALLIATAQGSTTESPANYIACSSLSIAPSMGDTTLPGEIINNGFLRQQATFGGYVAPTVLDGPASYTLSTTFVAIAPQVVNSIACFTAATGGTLFAELNIATQNLVAQSTLAIVWTFNI